MASCTTIIAKPDTVRYNWTNKSFVVNGVRDMYTWNLRLMQWCYSPEISRVWMGKYWIAIQEDSAEDTKSSWSSSGGPSDNKIRNPWHFVVVDVFMHLNCTHLENSQFSVQAREFFQKPRFKSPARAEYPPNARRGGGRLGVFRSQIICARIRIRRFEKI